MNDHQPSSDSALADSEQRIPAMAVSRGIGIGKAIFLKADQPVTYLSNITHDQAEDEIERFRSAVIKSTDELSELIANSKNESPESASSIFAVHLLILEGSSFAANVELCISENLVNADSAVRKVADEYVERQKSAEDQHLRDKYLDIQDIADRLQRALGPQSASEIGDSGCVLIVSELMPSRLIELARSGPAAIISEHGGWTSHASILARELNLPVVTGVRGIDRLISDGDHVIVDGVDGQIIVRPTAATLDHYHPFADIRRPMLDSPADERPAVTLDGCEIIIRVNADLPPTYLTGARYGAKGIGLYRSEVILSQFREFPSEDEQAEVYRNLAETTGEAGVRIRTFDISVEQLDGGRASKERNPSLGLRSIRLSLTDSAHFRTQVRAILRAAYQQNVDIVLPMISGVFEILRLREIIDEERANLQNRGVQVGTPGVGGMIEVPSAVLTANEIARHVDFLCLGTNDLVQYLLAVDRDNETVADWYQTLHPAVIRAIREVIDAGNKAGIPVAICGETAGSAFYVPLLVGLGARELSMNVNSIPQIRHLVAGIAVQDAVKLVGSIEDHETAAEIERTLRDHYVRVWSHLFPPGLLSSKFLQ